MSDDDRDSKTEDATHKRIEDALEKGDVPVARDVALLASFAALLVTSHFVLPAVLGPLISALAGMFERSGYYKLSSPGDAASFGAGTIAAAASFVMPVALLLMLAGVVASAAQNLPRIVLKRVAPDWARVSPAKGWARLFGSDGRIEFLKAVIKLLAAVGMAAATLAAVQGHVRQTLFLQPSLLPQVLLQPLVAVLTMFTCAAAALAVADLVLARQKWNRSLRMSKQDVKTELKEADGNPQVKARLRALAQRHARRRMINSVPRATLVIANPTHFAIALRYVGGENGAPLVLAKGTDDLALRIRAVAEKNNIPVVENKALARSLYDVAEIDRMIPTPFYRAVAEIIHYVASRNAAQQLSRHYDHARSPAKLDVAARTSDRQRIERRGKRDPSG